LGYKDFCIKALQDALKVAKPKIFNTDQGSQFTSREAIQDIGKYFDFYNNIRPHMSLNYQTPAEIYFDGFFQRKVLS